MGRKRPRSRAALTDDDEQPIDIIDESTESAQDHGSNSQTDDLPEERREELHADVWDAFKEEHHEVLEQLPLSVHRQFKLMRELDSHSASKWYFHVDLLASVRRYIQLRESLAARNTSNAVEAQPNATTHLNTADVGETSDMSPNAMQVDSTESTHDATPNPGETTRTRLQHIAQTSEEAIRTAEEKVNIAQTAYETVDRHIRLLDQAIKEQEAAISLGVRPGTHLAPILLPDLVVPRWARATRVEHSPVPSLSPEPGLYIEEPPILELSPPSIPSPKKEETHPPVVVDGEESLAASRTRRMSVRLTLPAQQPVAVEPTVPADPREKRYLLLQPGMIGCDMPGCKLEWFHFECTGLLEVPNKKTKWYCQECKPKMTQKGRSKA
ncbi:hypothetical protein EV363DRAFT_1318807 [Boletus edulis]|nr:hypothetical protein EV363DRAFT_1318807 [Boletus edulis]